jgi:hypothetical protein
MIGTWYCRIQRWTSSSVPAAGLPSFSSTAKATALVRPVFATAASRETNASARTVADFPAGFFPVATTT